LARYFNIVQDGVSGMYGFGCRCFATRFAVTSAGMSMNGIKGSTPRPQNGSFGRFSSWGQENSGGVETTHGTKKQFHRVAIASV